MGQSVHNLGLGGHSRVHSGKTEHGSYLSKTRSLKIWPDLWCCCDSSHLPRPMLAQVAIFGHDTFLCLGHCVESGPTCEQINSACHVLDRVISVEQLTRFSAHAVISIVAEWLDNMLLLWVNSLPPPPCFLSSIAGDQPCW